MTGGPRVLQVAASGVTVAKLLRPLIDRLAEEGYDVESACGAGAYASEMARAGYTVHTPRMSRTLSPARNLASLWDLWRLMSRGRYDVVHVHTPVAAAVGRLAAAAARTRIVIYTAHGFYFHDRMSPGARIAATWAERAMGRLTHMLLTQSAEDAQAAIREGIAPQDRVRWISNGVDVGRFSPPGPEGARSAREAWGIAPHERVVGFMGRLVREKGILELVDALRSLSRDVPSLVLLVAGDSAAAGDRDQETAALVRRMAEDGGLPYRIVFTGFIDDVEKMMSAVDVFALPSHREGMPRSVIEAMACGRPVVASDIRGCREEVLHGVTGLLAPAGDAAALADALGRVLSDPAAAAEMGRQGRQRAEEHFDEADVLDRQVEEYARLVQERLPASAAPVRAGVKPAGTRERGA